MKVAEVIAIVEDALREMGGNVKPLPTPSDAAARPRNMWPTEVSASTLAWVFTAVRDKKTAVCAIGIGAQYDRPSTASMQAGAAIHAALLPLIAKRIPGSAVEHRFSWEGVRGVVDLLVPRELILELKTTTSASGRSARLSVYEETQAAIYAAAFGMNCLVVVTDASYVLYHEVVSGGKATAALSLLREYREVAAQRPTPPYGTCGVCVYKETCGAKEANLCVACLKPLVEADVLWINQEIGVHLCGQAVRRVKKGLVCVRVSGGKLVEKKK